MIISNDNTKHIGEYKHYTYCRFCESKKIVKVIDLGLVPLAGGFLKSQDDFTTELFYPLEIYFCKKCFLLQSINVINKDTLFKDYFYHSSAIHTLTQHFKNVCIEISTLLKKRENPFVLEIGCNDGTLIQELVRNDIRTLGVDPAKNIVTPLIKKGLPIINDYFSTDLAKKIVRKFGKADVICSFNVMAHIEDMHDIVKGIKLLLKDDGILFFETHYVGNVLEELQYDMIYHEHQYYYSLLTLQNLFALHEMEIFNIERINIHGGSMRYYVQHKSTGKNSITNKVKTLENEELENQYHTLIPYQAFQKKIMKTKQDLLSLLNKIRKNDLHIAGYGASGRGTTIMNYCNLDNVYLDYVIDDAPAKQNTYVPGTHLKIVNSKILVTKEKVDYVILFAWSFLKEIKKRNSTFLKNGGKFIIPLPEVKIITK